MASRASSSVGFFSLLHVCFSTRHNSHYKLALDVLLTLQALSRRSRVLWLLWFFTYFDFFDPFVHKNKIFF